MASRQAAARFNAAQKAYDRARQLYEGKAISLAELQERQARLEVERADLENAQNRLRLLGAGGVPPLCRKAPGPALVFALRCPIAGRVVDRKVTPGLVVKEDEELFTVADTSTLWCFVQIPEKDLSLVKIGFPGDHHRQFLVRARNSRARWITWPTWWTRPAAPSGPGCGWIIPQNRLKAGMFANIAVRVGQRTVLSIPESAVLAANGELFVFVEMAPGTYQKHLVKTGVKGGGRVEVLEGLEADEPVVVQGGFTLKSELEKGAQPGRPGRRAWTCPLTPGGKETEDD